MVSRLSVQAFGSARQYVIPSCARWALGVRSQGNVPASENAVPVSVTDIKDVTLQRMTVPEGLKSTVTVGETVAAGSLWKDQPAVVYVVRRPGCILCREHARELSEKQPEFAAKGVKLLGVVHEKLGVEDFASGFFKNGGVYFDEEKAFFNALGMRWQGLTGVLTPSVISNVRRARSKGVEGNLVGEGRLLGGLLVVDAGDAGVVFEHREAVFGNHANMEDIMKAVDSVAKTSS